MSLASRIWAVYRRELRASLRERSIVIAAFVVPVFLYPTLIWLTFTGITFVQGETEKLRGRVAIAGDAALLPELPRRIEAEPRLTLAGALDRTAAVERLRAGAIDLAVALERGENDTVRLELFYDGSRDRSTAARDRCQTLIGELRDERLADLAAGAGIPPARWAMFTLERKNVATGREMGAFLLSMLLPLILVIIIAIGTMAAAIDATAGERERSTWETTLSLALPRPAIALAKYLHVATLGTVAGLLNVAAMVLTLRAMLSPLLREHTGELQVRLGAGALAIVALGIVLTALLLAAAMMTLASLARTFREGQSMVMPVYLLAVLPLLALSDPGLHLDLRWALVPVAGVLLMLREALNGSFDGRAIALALAVQAVLIALCLALASRLLDREEFLIGTIGRRPLAFLRRVLAERRGPGGAR